MNALTNIETALATLRQGGMVILMDDDKRENEGDLIMAADKITPDAINFMRQYATGMLCLALSHQIVERLQLPMMPERHKRLNRAAFTVSIDAALGVSSGSSSQDRVKTIQVAIDSASSPEDIAMPGHVFPLRACEGGVLERQGHTEGSVDLARLAGLTPAAVICEMINEDGNMARLSDLEVFAKQHHIQLVSINDLIAYRRSKEVDHHAII